VQPRQWQQRRRGGFGHASHASASPPVFQPLTLRRLAARMPHQRGEVFPVSNRLTARRGAVAVDKTHWRPPARPSSSAASGRTALGRVAPALPAAVKGRETRPRLSKCEWRCGREGSVLHEK
jgi:hypothetical protein